MNKYNKVVFTCRTQPPHKGHFTVLKASLALTDQLIIIVGSANSARNIVNPFTFSERVKLISSALSKEELSKIKFLPQPDFPYNMDMWLASVIELVDQQPGERVAVISSDKDDDHKLRQEWFPFWEHETVHTEHPLNATDIRKILFEKGADAVKSSIEYGALVSELSEFMYPETIKVMFDILIDTFDERLEYNIFDYLLEEWKVSKARKEPYEKAVAAKIIPYLPMHNTIDNVVTCAGHILVVKRGKFPGKNLLAIPGGFLEHDETTFEGALRELHEETKLDFPPKKLLLHIAGEKVFDHPKRSQVGRLITHSFYFILPAQTTDANGKKIRANKGLPLVDGTRDVDGGVTKAWWMPIKEFLEQEEYIHDDHKHIVEYYVNKPNQQGFYK